MDTTEAQEHIAMVDRILARADGPVCLSAFPFVVWGLAGAVMNIAVQLVIVEHYSTWVYAGAAAALFTAIALSIVWAQRLRGLERRTLIDRQVFYAFNMAWVVAFVAQIGAANIFAQWAQAGLWLLMYGAAMIFVGMLVRSLPTFIGGAILLAALVVANFFLPYAGFIFAAGDLIGMTGAGIVLYATRR
jgi:hypothetical protein